MSARVIVVEDEAMTRELYVRTLRGAGHEVEGAGDAAACRALLAQRPADLIMLDLGLPGEDGLSLARELRRTESLGLIVVSRRHTPEDRVGALELGCDDYLVKPVHLGEFCARAAAVIRRRGRRLRLRFGAALLDLQARTLEVDGRAIPLTRGEFSVLQLLASAGGAVMARETLLEPVSRSPEDSDPRTVDALVRRIRRKLEPHISGEVIVTAPGLGYRLGLAVHEA